MPKISPPETTAAVGCIVRRSPAVISIDYPEDQTIFPPEIIAPVFIWHDPDSRENLAECATDPKELQIQYDLYRIPFNAGPGGTPEPIEGVASNGMSNSFPKISPDGRRIVYVQSHNGLLMRPNSRVLTLQIITVQKTAIRLSFLTLRDIRSARRSCLNPLQAPSKRTAVPDGTAIAR